MTANERIKRADQRDFTLTLPSAIFILRWPDLDVYARVS